MKRAIAGIVLLLVVLAGCGGGNSNSNQPATSGIKNRALVTNTFSGQLELYDADFDRPVTSFFLGAAPTFMALTPGRESTLIFDSGSNAVQVFSNGTETVGGSIQLPGATQSIVAKDANTAYAAVPTAIFAGKPSLGVVAVLDLQKFTIPSSIAVPAARRIVLNGAGTQMLVFSDNSNSVTVVDIASSTPTEVSGFDRPVLGFFASDDSKAFIVNCGAECGGTAAGVQVLTLGATPAAGAALPLSAATTAVLINNTLFVAGTINGPLGQGVLNTVDISSGVPVAGSVRDVPISDGLHTLMAPASNNKLFIGSTNCTNDPNSADPTGCLTIFDTSTNTAVIDTARDPNLCRAGETCTVSKGFVTGMSPVPNRNIVYVIQGGELRVFDTTNSEEIPNKIDVVGQATDVKLIDQPAASR
ncbi:MAG: YncE family protein [Terriglobales bacterium]